MSSIILSCTQLSKNMEIIWPFLWASIMPMIRSNKRTLLCEQVTFITLKQAIYDELREFGESELEKNHTSEPLSKK